MSQALAHRATTEDAPLVPGEFAMSARDFSEIAAIVKATSGIDLPPSKAALVYSRLGKRLREHGLDTFHAYCDLVRDDQDERQRMIAAITTNVTRFYREPHHFDHLREKVLRPLVDAARRGERVRLWSAACSTGQEPYSMALTVLSVLPEAPRLDVRILATDLNPFVVEHGRRGIYEEQELADVPADLRRRWFEAISSDGGRRWQANEDARALVSFRELNLLGRWPMKGQFHAIFCRNVVIYFDRPTQVTLWDRFEKLIAPKGALYIGHSERLSDDVGGKLGQDGITTYVKRDGAGR